MNHEVVAGIDVHKHILMVVVERQRGERVDSEKFLTTVPDLRRMRDWLLERRVDLAVMESTAQYWWPVWRSLEECGIELRLAQARSNAAPHGRKTYFRDAERLVRRCFSEDLRYSYVPGTQQRQWRRLTRTWKSFGDQIVSARNEIECLLEEGQIKLSCIVTDLLGLSGRRALRAIVAGDTNPEKLDELMDNRIRAPKQDRLDALTGQLPPAHRLALRQHLDLIEMHERQREELEQALIGLMEQHEPKVELLTRIPGINVIAARHLIAELGPEAAAFPTASHCASWAGVCPGRQESAGESTSNRSPKGNRFVRTLINQVAHAAARTKGSRWQVMLDRLKPRLGYAKAVWAIAHKLLCLIWRVLRVGLEYVELGPAADNPKLLAKRLLRLRSQFNKIGIDLEYHLTQRSQMVPR